MNEEKRLQRRQRLMDNKAYQTMEGLTRYMDRYYLDALIGVIPGWGDAIAVLLGMIPFFVGDIIDIFHRANTQNMQMIQGFVDGDEAVIKQVNQRAWQSVIVLMLLLLLIALMIWMLISFGSYIYSLVTSIV